MLLIAIVVLGVLIFFHELGHFLVAKWNGVAVVEFSIGFGKKVFQWKRGETTYSIGLVPLGGYVRMVGDDPRSVYGGPLTPEEEKEKLAELQEYDPLLAAMPAEIREDRSRWFLSKGYWAKTAIVFAGPFANFLLAFVISVASFWMYGKGVPVDLPIIGGVMSGFPAEQAGIQEGDRIKKVGEKEVFTWEEMSEAIASFSGKEMVLLIDRPVLDSETGEQSSVEEIEISVSGREEGAEMAILEGKEPTEEKRFKIGIMADATREDVGFVEGFELGALHIGHLSIITVRGLWGMIRGAISPTNIAGPIFIFNEAAKTARKGLENLLAFMVFLSVSLAILNLLPIPILDGGHLVFFTIEAIKGGPLSLRAQSVANQIGLAILLLLMVFALGNDLYKLIWSPFQ